jgi:hypothetical protein
MFGSWLASEFVRELTLALLHLGFLA